MVAYIADHILLQSLLSAVDLTVRWITAGIYMCNVCSVSPGQPVVGKHDHCLTLVCRCSSGVRQWSLSSQWVGLCCSVALFYLTPTSSCTRCHQRSMSWHLLPSTSTSSTSSSTYSASCRLHVAETSSKRASFCYAVCIVCHIYTIHCYELIVIQSCH